MTTRHACPCCGFLTLHGKPPGTDAICPVCFWQDDSVQGRDAEYEGGANRVSLREARQNFRALGACEPEFKGKVRPPMADEVPPSRS